MGRFLDLVKQRQDKDAEAAYINDTLDERQKEFYENGDHDKFSHYVNKNDLMKSLLEGVEIEALCGKMWVATRDGTKFPKCPECVRKWEELEDA